MPKILKKMACNPDKQNFTVFLILLFIYSWLHQEVEFKLLCNKVIRQYRFNNLLAFKNDKLIERADDKKLY